MTSSVLITIFFEKWPLGGPWDSEINVWSVVFSCSVVVQNQNERPENEYNSALLNIHIGRLRTVNWAVLGQCLSL